METGYIKLYRKLLDSAVFANESLFKLWMLCLMKANHKDQWVTFDNLIDPIHIKKGQFITGRFSLHQDFYITKRNILKGKSPLTVWRWLEKLEKLENLNIKTYNKYSIITIINWDSYQGNEQQANNKRTTSEQQVNTDKNEKNEKKNNICPYNDILNLYHNKLSSLPVVRVFSDKRKKHLNARFNEKIQNKDKTLNSSQVEWWEIYFNYVGESDFLMGRKTNFKADFEWLINQSNLIKVIEGKYENQ